ncbi:MAG: hypothetical protein KKA07_09605 [Bacteroidetes bacterium]|nr:hypothetical protein [Bacteroidota bacterium]MBU1719316.1 hypothetical protein [Bacteroidota bacterium]
MKKHFSKAGFVIVIIAFFLPFIVVKCSNGTELVRASGMQIITRSNLVDDGNSKNSSSEKSGGTNPRIFSAISFLCALGGLVFLFLNNKNREKIAFVLGIVGLFFLIFMVLDINMSIPAKAKNFITISPGYGYYLAIIGFLIADALLLLDFLEKRKKPDIQVPPVLQDQEPGIE